MSNELEVFDWLFRSATDGVSCPDSIIKSLRHLNFEFKVLSPVDMIHDIEKSKKIDIFQVIYIEGFLEKINKFSSVENLVSEQTKEHVRKVELFIQQNNLSLPDID